MSNNKVKKDGRVLPHSIEGEQSVLGCVLIDQDASFSILSELKENDFYIEAHKLIFNSALNLLNSNSPVDLVTLTDNLEKNDLLDSVGGIDYITTLTNIVPSASNFKHYIEIVKRDSVLRKLISASQDIISNSFDGGDKESAIAFAEKNIFEIGQNEERSNLSLLKDSIDEVMDKFEIIQKDKNSLRGIPTGIYGIDKATNGLQPGDLVLIAARPSFGKTSLAMNMVNYAAIQGKRKVAVFSLEMPKVQLAQRSLCSIAYVDMEKALKGELGVKDWQALWSAKDKLNKANMYVDDSSLNTPIDVLSKCRKLKREQGLDLIMIDYLQLMNAGGKAKDNRQQEISDITRGLKIAARELQVPIILLSQLSRAVESRKDHRPVLSDLRESGAIEQDADIVIFIHRPERYDTPETPTTDNIVELIIAKHRNGPLANIKVKFIEGITTFVNLEKDANSQSLEAKAPKENTVKVEDLPPITPLDDSEIIDDIF